jgi:predicted GNAT family N-acyltransferase
MKEVIVKEIQTGTPEYQQLLQFRNDLLRRPLGLDLFAEDLSDDEKDIILAAVDNKEIVGCVMLHPVDKESIKLRQMAVSEALQGKGLGKILVSEAEQAAAEEGYQRIVLHARITAQEFYQKAGYTPTGDIFTEVTIPHIAMEKTLG